jgi:hypothetical protein
VRAQSESRPGLVEALPEPSHARSEPESRGKGGSTCRPLLKRAALAGLVIGSIATLAALDFPVCLTAGVLGLPCPGCGLTRATLAALHGRFEEAFRLHPLFLPVAPIYAYFVGSLAYRYVLGSRAKPPSRIADQVVTGMALTAIALLTGVWVARFFGAFGGPAPVRTWASFMH